MKAILLIDHGSMKVEANEMLGAVRDMVQEMAGADVLVGYAHMELAEPSIASGVRNCVDAGATELIVFPYMLSPGKHSTGDIPRMVTAAAARFRELLDGSVRHIVAPHGIGMRFPGGSLLSEKRQCHESDRRRQRAIDSFHGFHLVHWKQLSS